MDGAHSIERCEEVTCNVLHAVFRALFEQGVRLEEMLLKPNMVVAGAASARQADVREVATATLRCLRRHAPAAVPGVVFLSGGQRDVVATRHLDAIHRAGGPKPWKLSFSYGRALQDAAMAAWRGKPENRDAAQRAFLPPREVQRPCRARRVRRDRRAEDERNGAEPFGRLARRLVAQYVIR